MNVSTPDWVKDAVFYQIFPDRFAQSRDVPKPSNLEAWDSPPTRYGFKGGDLLGVVERLDYLADLGVTALYLNPIFRAASNHRYNTHDYYEVDPILGGNAALRALVDAAHARGMRVVLDGVFNHVGRGFFQFNHLLECGGASPYVDWFTAQNFPLSAYDRHADLNYVGWFGSRALPKLNLHNPVVRKYIFDVAEHWIRFGVDGWRLDAAEQIEADGFWQEFRQRVKAVNPEAYIVGEIWFPAERYLQGDQFDGVTNYLFMRPAVGFFGARTLDDYVKQGHLQASVLPLDAPGFARAIEAVLARYPWEITLAQLNLLNSHDTPRFLSLVGGDESALRLALLCLLTMPGAPNLYYGDELGLPGGPDPGCRGAMPWAQAEARGDLWRYTQQAIALRKAHPALRRGTYATVLAEGDLLAYTRALDGATVLVILNAGQEPALVALPVGGLSRLAFGASPQCAIKADNVQVVVPARSGIVVV